MKRFVFFLLALVMALTCVSCGPSLTVEPEEDVKTQGETTVEEETEETEEEETTESVEEETEETEEEKTNAAAKYVYGYMAWIADTKGNITEQAVHAEEKNFIERIKKEPIFQSYLKDLDRQWVTSKKNDNRLPGIQKEIERNLRLNERKTLENILSTKTTEIQKREEKLRKEEELKHNQEKKASNIDNEMKEEEPEMGGR